MTSEGTRTREKVYIIGHKNPDTDSICSAIAYTELKKAVLERKLADGTFEAENPLQEGVPVPIPEYIACRAGIVNEETKYVLEYFDVEPPQYQDNVQPQIADMDLNLVPGIEGRASIKQAWELMQEEHAKSVPVLAEGKLKGIVTITDIAQSYMDKSDSSVLSRAGTRFASIAETLNGHIVCGGSDEVFEDGKVTIAASSPDVMEEVIEPSDLPFSYIVPVSCKDGTGFDLLEQAFDMLFPDDAPCDGSLLTNARQADAIVRAKKSVDAALRSLRAGFTPDAVLVDLEAAMRALGEVTGRTMREDITNRIFERFCVGK